MEKLKRNSGETKYRVKLYKAGKLWLAMGLTSVAIGITAIVNTTSITASADTTEATAQSTEASAVAASTATLKTTAADTTTTDQQVTTPAKTSTTPSTAGSTTTDQKTPIASVDDVKTDDVASPTSDERGNDTAATDTTTPQETVTNLGDAKADQLAAAKATASAAYAKTGIVQKVTAMDADALVQVQVKFKNTDDQLVSESTVDMSLSDFQSGNYDKPELAGYVTGTVTPINDVDPNGSEEVIFHDQTNNTVVTPVTITGPALIAIVYKDEPNVHLIYYVAANAQGNSITANYTRDASTSYEDAATFSDDPEHPNQLVLDNLLTGYRPVKIQNVLTTDTLNVFVEIASGYSQTEKFSSQYVALHGEGENQQAYLLASGPGQTITDYTSGNPYMSIPSVLATNADAMALTGGRTINFDESTVTITVDGKTVSLSLNDYLEKTIGLGLSASDADLAAFNQMAQEKLANANWLDSIILGFSPLVKDNAIQTAYEKAIATHSPYDIYDFLVRATYPGQLDILQVGGTSSTWSVQYVMNEGQVPENGPQKRTQVGPGIYVTKDQYYDNRTPDNGGGTTTTPTDNGGGTTTTPTNNGGSTTTAPTDNGTTTTTQPTTGSQTTTAPGENTQVTATNGGQGTTTGSTQGTTGTNQTGTVAAQQANGTVAAASTGQATPTTVATNQNAVAGQATNDNAKAATLPQTNDDQSTAAAVSGLTLLAALGSLLGFGVTKRRKMTH